MSRTNTVLKHQVPRSAEGAPAARISPEQELRRTLAACLLWEDSFYENGEDVADRIRKLVPLCRPEFVAACAYEARTVNKLRHAPLLVVAVMAGCVPHAGLVGKLLPDVIQRADELSEFLAIYAKINGVTPDKVKGKLSKQVKLGLARAFQKFDEYALAKYDREGAVKLRDVLFLVHAKPKDDAQDALWKRLIAGKLETPDTWEVQLSAGEDKKLTFERLMAEGKLGALAYLRNLRNMQQAGVSLDLVKGYADVVDITRVLPFRFIAAARVVPAWEHVLEPMMLRACEGREKLPGRTMLLVDVSGSMNSQVSSKSDLNRLDAAAGVAILLRELCEDIEVLAFHDRVEPVPPRRGFALRDAIGKTRGGTMLGSAVNYANRLAAHDRVIVLTDEQSHDVVPNPVGRGYMINVASNKNGVGYGKWMRVDGWSEGVIDYIQAFEAQALPQ